MTEDDLKQAVALFYDGNNAPTISAMGSGDTAQEIIDIALASGVTLCENQPLLELLMSLELGDEIPQSLYIAIAQIISFAYQLQGKVPADTELSPA